MKSDYTAIESRINCIDFMSWQNLIFFKYDLFNNHFKFTLTIYNKSDDFKINVEMENA